MIEKTIPISSSLSDCYDIDGGQAGDKSFLLDMDGSAMRKVASMGSFIPPDLERAIRSIQAAPDPKMVYLYDRALGAGEHYGPNNNGDWFGRQELINQHPTFVTDGALYRHHKSSGPNIGDVMASAYNDRLDTVDLIIRAPVETLASDLEKLKKGGVIATSMGARVKHDICSYCGNKARTRALYCDHLKRQMLQIFPGGKQVFAINPKPIFKDISIVVIPAAPESVVLRKIANLQEVQRHSKAAEMKKEVGSITSPTYDGENRDPIGGEAIDATNHMSRADALQTLHDASGPLRPDEFQAVMRKDASCIRPDIIPFVGFESVEKVYLSGRSMSKVANIIRNNVVQPLSSSARLSHADFLAPREKRAYLQYRKASDSFLDTRFVR